MKTLHDGAGYRPGEPHSPLTGGRPVQPAAAAAGRRGLLAALALGAVLLLGGPGLLRPTPLPACDLEEFESQYRNIVRAVRPSVVAVIAYSDLGRASAAGAGAAAGARPGDRPESLKKSVGSGIVLDDQGHVLTVASVIGDSRTITVRTPEGREMPAVRLGADRRTDLALLAVSGAELHPAPLGRSADLTTGCWLITVGQQFGTYPSCSFGTYTALSTNALPVAGGDLLQSTARIYPGQTGGAVVNLAGQVVGLLLGATSSGVSPMPGTELSGGATASDLVVEASVAIPIDLARKVAAALQENGTAAPGYLGVKVRMPTAALKELLNFEEGVLIDEVVGSSPAAAATIEAGDIILEFDGKAVRHPAALVQLVGARRPGSRCEVVLLRGDIRLRRMVTVGVMPEHLLAAESAAPSRTVADTISGAPPARQLLERRIADLRHEIRRLEAELTATSGR